MNSQTIKLYDENAYACEFTAKVISCVKDEKKDGLFVITLDRTLFFPEEGGQTPDKGTIYAVSSDEAEAFDKEGRLPGCAAGETQASDGACKGDALKAAGATVMDVRIKNNVIFHVVDREFSEGETVFGCIDWTHRFSNMQQHTGEHIFSGIVNKWFSYDNVGFHLSDSVVTMDYSGQLSAEDMQRVEAAVNRAIYENRSIRTWYPEKDELEKIDYRSKKELTGAVRIVEVEGYDICACCAPHVHSTGEIGILKVISFQNYKGGTRVSILCGRRAFEFLSGEHAMIQELAGELSTSGDNIPAIVHKQQEEISVLKRRLSDTGEKLLDFEVEKLPEDQKNAFLFSDSGSDPNVIRRVVNRVVSEKGGYCGIFFGSDDEGYRFIIGCPEGLNSNDVIAALKKSLQVRGGGKPAMVQGSIEGAVRTEIEEALGCFL